MMVTDDPALARKARYLTTQAKDDEVRYIHNEVGYNFRMTNLQAAMGVAQLEQLPAYLEIKKKNYWRYKKEIDQIPGLSLAQTPPYADNNFWMYCLQINKHLYGKDKETLMLYLGEHQIQTRPVWQLNHMQKPYLEGQVYRVEKALTMHEITLNIPCSVNLTNAQIEEVLERLRK